MNAQERDELLIRIDERTRNIYHLTEKQEHHLDELNASVSKNVARIASNYEAIKGNRRILNIIIWCILGTSAIGGGVYGIIQALG